MDLAHPEYRYHEQKFRKDKRTKRDKKIEDEGGLHRIAELVGAEKREASADEDGCNETAWLEIVEKDGRSDENCEQRTNHPRPDSKQHKRRIELSKQINRERQQS